MKHRFDQLSEHSNKIPHLIFTSVFNHFCSNMKIEVFLKIQSPRPVIGFRVIEMLVDCVTHNTSRSRAKRKHRRASQS